MELYYFYFAYLHPCFFESCNFSHQYQGGKIFSTSPRTLVQIHGRKSVPGKIAEYSVSIILLFYFYQTQFLVNGDILQHDVVLLQSVLPDLKNTKLIFPFNFLQRAFLIEYHLIVHRYHILNLLKSCKNLAALAISLSRTDLIVIE